MNISRLPRVWFTLLLLPLAACLLRAQTDPLPSPSALASPTPPAPVVERTVYTPYQQLEQVFENGGRGVFLPYREFLDLWNKLNLPADLKKNQPPVDGVLASAHYTGRIDGDAAIFDAQLQFDALKDGWSKVPLGGTDLNIAEVKPGSPSTPSPSPSIPSAPGSRPAPVLHLAADGYEAILPAKGSYPVALAVLGKVTREEGKSTLLLRLPRTAASQFELTIPETGLDFTLTPAAAFTAHEENGGTRLAAFFGSTTEVSIAWKQRAVETTLPALVFAETALETSVMPGALHTVATVDFRLLRAPVSAFELLVPTGQQVLGVEGSGLRDWTLAAPAPDGRQRIAVNLAAPARETYQLRVTLELPIASLPSKVSAPTLEVAHAEGQSGTVSVAADPSLAVAINPREGITQQGVTNPKPFVPDNPASGPAGTFLGVYRFLHLPYALDLDVRAAEPVVDVDARTLLTVGPDVLEWQSALNYNVTKAGVFAVSVDVPAALGHVEATGDLVEGFSVVTTPASGTPAVAAGYLRLEVPLRARTTGKFTINITGDVPRAKADDAVAVAIPHPAGVARDEGKVAVAIHQSLDPKTADAGDLRQEGIDGLGTPGPRDPTTYPVALGFSYRGGAAKPARVTFTLRKPRVNAEIASRVSLRESLVAFQWTVNYNVEYAGIDDLVLDAPPGVADDLQFSGDDIKEKAREDETDAAGKPTGKKLWHIRLQQKKLGAYALRVSLERPLPPPAVGKTASVDWPELRTVGPFHETGTVAVVKADNLEITRATPTGLEMIDPAELPGQPPPARATPKGEPMDVFLAYRYAAHPAALRLEFSKNEFLPVPTAVVTYAMLNTTLTADRAETTEAIYWVRNNGRQFLSVVLPERGQMLSDVFVNGQPQQPARRPDKPALLVRLPASETGTGDAPISVRLVYAVARDPSKGDRSLGASGHFLVMPPRVEETRVMQAQWSVYLPGDYRYVSFSSSMREVLGPRGWNWWRDWLDPLVPSLGPGGMETSAAEWQEPPTLPTAASGGFDSPVPKDGTPIVLRGLDAPGLVDVSYRSLAYQDTLEAVAFFLAFGFGSLAVGRAARLGYFFFVGIGALILAGAVMPRSAGVWTAVYLGVFAAAMWWVATGSWKWLRRLMHRVNNRRKLLMTRMRATMRPPPRNPPPPPATPPEPPAVSPTPNVP